MRIWQQARGEKISGHWIGKASDFRPRLLAALALLILGSTAAAQDAPRLTVVSWNLEWLAKLPSLYKHGFSAKYQAKQFSNDTVVNRFPPCSSVGAFGRTAELYEKNKLLPQRKRLV